LKSGVKGRHGNEKPELEGLREKEGSLQTVTGSLDHRRLGVGRKSSGPNIRYWKGN